jgi:hypothetical protein
MRCTPIDGEDGRETEAAGLQQLLLAAHVEKAVMLPGETRRGEILRGCGAAHRHADGSAGLVLEFAIRLEYLPRERRGQPHLIDDRARLPSLLSEQCHIDVLPQWRERLAQAVQRAGGVQQVAIGPGGDRETVRHRHAQRRQLPVQLAERGVLASDLLDVLEGYVLEPPYIVLRRLHVISP